MFTVGQIRELIKGLPDEALVLQDDPFSEFSYDIDNAQIGYTKLSHTTNDNENFYETWSQDYFEDFLNDNPEDKQEILNEYKSCLVLSMEEE